MYVAPANLRFLIDIQGRRLLLLEPQERLLLSRVDLISIVKCRDQRREEPRGMWRPLSTRAVVVRGRGVATRQELDFDGERYASAISTSVAANARLLFIRSASFGDGTSSTSATPGCFSNFIPSGKAETASL